MRLTPPMFAGFLPTPQKQISLAQSNHFTSNATALMNSLTFPKPQFSGVGLGKQPRNDELKIYPYL